MTRDCVGVFHTNFYSKTPERLDWLSLERIVKDGLYN